VVEPLLENPRALTGKIAETLGGTAIERSGLSGFLSSKFDRFLNQLFASGHVAPREAAAALEGWPGFVWLAEKPNAEELGRLRLLEMYGMTATTAVPSEQRPPQGEIGEVRSREDLDGWFRVYAQVFGAHPNARDEWARIHDALGQAGDGSLLLLLARVDGAPAATGAVFFQPDAAGLYCFTTLERMRRRGLASALMSACHEAAQARGIERAVLQATASGRPAYARAGYREERSLPVLLSPWPDA
jgi:ribosomal protein S18 acetylase RimI-like enzyme